MRSPNRLPQHRRLPRHDRRRPQSRACEAIDRSVLKSASNNGSCCGGGSSRGRACRCWWRRKARNESGDGREGQSKSTFRSTASSVRALRTCGRKGDATTSKPTGYQPTIGRDPTSLCCAGKGLVAADKGGRPAAFCRRWRVSHHKRQHLVAAIVSTFRRADKAEAARAAGAAQAAAGAAQAAAEAAGCRARAASPQPLAPVAAAKVSSPAALAPPPPRATFRAADRIRSTTRSSSGQRSSCRGASIPTSARST